VLVLESDFALDSSHDVKVSQEDVTFLQILRENVVQQTDNHLEMPLPFMDGRPVLPNNKGAAMVRLSHLKRKLTRYKDYYEKYKQVMSEMIERGDAEAAPESPTSVNGTYHIMTFSIPKSQDNCA